MLPTIDIMSPTSLHSWSVLRKMVKDYGFKFLKRHELFLGAIAGRIFLTSMILLEIMLLNWTGLKDLDYKHDYSIEKLEVYCFFDLFLLLSIVMS